MKKPVFVLDRQMQADIAQMNPWWAGDALAAIPETRRHLVGQIERRLQYRLAPIIVVRGSRQIGKTTACLQVINGLLSSGVAPKRIFRVQFDLIRSFRFAKEPILHLVYWYEQTIIQNTLNNQARDQQPCYIFFDEVQNLEDWATQLKFLVDTSTVQVVVTGSSALRIEMGRDSLAGRINTLEAGTLSLTEIGALRSMPTPEPFLPDNGIVKLKDKSFWQELVAYGKKNQRFRDTAFAFFSERGAYPIAHARADVPWELVADQLNETVIRRVIQHDLRVGEKGRKRDPQLLEELFRFCCRYAGQSPSVAFIAEEMQKALAANIGPQRVRQYLRFLADTLLIRLVQPLEIRLKKRRSDSKICLVDHGLRASWLQEQIPLDPDSPETDEAIATQAGWLAESTVGSLFSSIGGLDIAHLPAKGRDPEIDFVLTIGTIRIPVEVKYRNVIKQEHIGGLKWFMDNPVNRAPFGIIITKKDLEQPLDDRIVAIPLRTLMLMR